MTHQPKRSAARITGTFLSVLLLASPTRTVAHAGHGDGAFHGGSQTAPAADSIQVDAETSKQMGLKVEPVSRQRLAFGIKTTGQIEALPNQQVEVTTPVTGTVTRLLVAPGDRVRAGEPVALMTSPELAERRTTALDRQSEAIGSRQQAQADLRLAQRNYAQQQTIAATDVAQAQTALNVAQEQFDKDRALLTNGAIPRRTFLESQNKLAEAKAALAKSASRLQVSEAVAQLERAQSAVQVAETRVQLSGDTYQTRLRQLGTSANQDGTLTITAPIAGTVADRETTMGESGQDAGKKVMTIINSRSVQVSGSLYEKDLAHIQTGQGVRVKPNGMPTRLFNGRISVVGAIVEGGSRVVPVKAALDNPDGALKPGMFVELEVLTDRTPAAVLALPRSAIVETNDKKTIVFAQNGNAFQATEVSLGRTSGPFVEVKSGLFDGDQVVTQGAPMLYAQSLLKSGQATALADPDDAPSGKATGKADNDKALPWWSMIPIVGAIASGTFWAGTFWAKRRSRRLPFESNGKPYANNDRTELHFDHTQPLTQTHSAHSLQEPQTPSAPDQE